MFSHTCCLLLVPLSDIVLICLFTLLHAFFAVFHTGMLVQKLSVAVDMVLRLTSKPNSTALIRLSDDLTPLALQSIQALVAVSYPPPNTPTVTIDQVIAALENSTGFESSTSAAANGARRALDAAAPRSLGYIRFRDDGAAQRRLQTSSEEFSVKLNFRATLASPLSSEALDAANASSVMIAASQSSNFSQVMRNRLETTVASCNEFSSYHCHAPLPSLL